MNFKLLENKLTITDANGVRYKDLISKTYEIKQELKIEEFFRVTKDLEGNLPGISFRFYGTTQYADAIAKINEISNPFSIEEGDVLFMVTIAQLINFYQVPKDKKSSTTD